MKIAIDFDGTCVKHEFPKVGADIGAIPVLRKLTKQGISLFYTQCGAMDKNSETY
jgi:hypothetical protein